MAKVFYTSEELGLKLDLLDIFKQELPKELWPYFTINTKALVGYFNSEHSVTCGIGGYSIHAPFVEGVGCDTILLGVSREELVAWCVGNMEVLK
jgi:hypothetical protein